MASVRSRTKIQRLGIPFTQPTPTYCAKRKSMMTNQQRSIASRSGSFSESNCFERPHHESDSHDHLLEPLSERVIVGGGLRNLIHRYINHEIDRKSTRLNSSHLGISY